MTKALVKTQVRLHQLAAEREAGQGTLEYVGMVIVAAIFTVGVVAAAKAAGLGALFATAIKSIVG